MCGWCRPLRLKTLNYGQPPPPSTTSNEKYQHQQNQSSPELNIHINIIKTSSMVGAGLSGNCGSTPPPIHWSGRTDHRRSRPWARGITGHQPPSLVLGNYGSPPSMVSGNYGSTMAAKRTERLTHSTPLQTECPRQENSHSR
jgi:hypothetical protein